MAWRRAARSGIAALALGALAGPWTGSASAAQTCAYPNTLDRLPRIEAIAGGPIRCVLVYNDTAPTWTIWQRPWFAQPGDANVDWAAWKRRRVGRRVIVTQGLVPTPLLAVDWRALGARGTFDAHYRALARRLVATGLGDSVIRLGAEMNDPGMAAYVGSTAADLRNWRALWRRAVRVMRSVHGAAFRFDWCVAGGFSPYALARMYPGDDVVDIVGVDLYDAGVPSGRGRWPYLRDMPLGARQMAAFARAHRKPLSVPEWGLVPRGDDRHGGGVDIPYMRGLATWLAHTRSVYDVYFYQREYARLLARSHAARTAYRRLFGPHR